MKLLSAPLQTLPPSWGTPTTFHFQAGLVLRHPETCVPRVTPTAALPPPIAWGQLHSLAFPGLGDGKEGAGRIQEVGVAKPRTPKTAATSGVDSTRNPRNARKTGPKLATGGDEQESQS